MFYHYKYYFTFIFNKTEREGGKKDLGGTKGLRRRGNSGNLAMVEQQAHIASLWKKRENGLGLCQAFFCFFIIGV